MSYSADDFDSFASKTKLLEADVVYGESPPSSRQSPVRENGSEWVNGVEED